MERAAKSASRRHAAEKSGKLRKARRKLAVQNVKRSFGNLFRKKKLSRLTMRESNKV